MNRLIFFLVLIVLYACGNNIENLPVTAIFTGADVSGYENPELNKKIGLKYMWNGMYLYFKIHNPNNRDVFIPLYSPFDTVFCSYINISINKQPLDCRLSDIENYKKRLIRSHSDRYIAIKVYEHSIPFEKYGFDIKKILYNMKFSYVKCDSDKDVQTDYTNTIECTEETKGGASLMNIKRTNPKTDALKSKSNYEISDLTFCVDSNFSIRYNEPDTVK